MFNRIFTIKMKSTGHNQKTNLNVMAVEALGKTENRQTGQEILKNKAPLMALFYTGEKTTPQPSSAVMNSRGGPARRKFLSATPDGVARHAPRGRRRARGRCARYAGGWR